MPVVIVRVSTALLFVMLNRSRKPRTRMPCPRLKPRSTRRSNTVMLSWRFEFNGSTLIVPLKIAPAAVALAAPTEI